MKIKGRQNREGSGGRVDSRWRRREFGGENRENQHEIFVVLGIESLLLSKSSFNLSELGLQPGLVQNWVFVNKASQP